MVSGFSRNSGQNIRKPALPIDLTGVEVVFLADQIQNDDKAKGLPDESTYMPLAREALLLLGSAYVELVESNAGIKIGPVTLFITEEIAWLLRSKVRTGDVAIDGRTPIGHILLLKLYMLLLQFNAGFITEKTVAEDVADVDGKLIRLSEWKAREYPNASNPTSDTNTDSTGDGTE